MGYDEAHTQESAEGENTTSGKMQRFVLLEMTPCDHQINVSQIGTKRICVPWLGWG